MSQRLSGQPSCLRCKTVTLEVLDTLPEITCYRCLHCKRHYAKEPGKGLVSRWGSPLSLALYGVIFAADAIPHVADTARELARSRDSQAIEALADEIQLELDEPTQRVAEIHDMAAPKAEEHLRDFLRLVVEELRQAVVGRQPP
jgi:hypothetical protein